MFRSRNQTEYLRHTPAVIGGRYRLVRPLGSGGMSTVYLAEDLKLSGKMWAVKQISALGESFPYAAEEAALLMKLSHPYLPHVVDYYPPDASGRSHIVMEYIDGVTLQQMFERSGSSIDPVALIRYGIQLCELLQYLHGIKDGPVIYRDIKPSNIMIDTQGHVRLIDFGIARTFRPDRQADTVPLGTVGFAAPELLERGCSDVRSDLYSLGAAFYYLLSGGRYYCAVREPLKPIKAPNGRLLAELIVQLLDDRPERRPQSAAEAGAMLRQCLEADKLAEADSIGEARVRPYRRLRIMVGGLYSGAGSTFITLAASRLLSEMRIPHAVVEHPAARAELYGLLDGDNQAPEQYEFAPVREDPRGARWSDGLTEWIVQSPSGILPDREQLDQRLYRIDAPVTIVDVGDRWRNEDVDRLCRDADLLVVIADPLPSRWSGRPAASNAEAIMKYREIGREVHFIANKSVSFSGKNRWLSSFPSRPSAVVPVVPFELLVSASWKGGLIHDAPKVRSQLREALGPWLARMIKSDRSTGGRKPFFGSFFAGRS